MNIEKEYAQEIKSIRKWQQFNMVHPLTCGNNSDHALLQPKVLRYPEEDKARLILICPNEYCTYAQSWIPGVVTSL